MRYITSRSKQSTLNKSRFNDENIENNFHSLKLNLRRAYNLSIDLLKTQMIK